MSASTADYVIIPIGDVKNYGSVCRATNRHSFLDKPNTVIPYEVFGLLLSYVDGPSLCRLNETCTTLRDNQAVIRDAWIPRLQKDFNIEDAADPKARYLQSQQIKVNVAKERVRQEQLRQQRERERVVHQAKQRSYRKYSYCLFYLTDVLTPLAIPSLIFAFTILAMYHLDHYGLSVPLPWKAAGLMLAVLVLLVVGLGLNCYVVGRDRPVPFMDRTKEFLQVFRTVAEGMLEGRQKGPFSVCFVATMTFFCFLLLKLAGSVGWSYPVVFIPFWLAIAAVCLLPCVEGHPRLKDLCGNVCIMVVVMVWPLLLGLLIMLRLDGHNIHLAVVMIPLWVLHLMMVIAACYGCADEGIVACVVWSFVAGLLFAFQVMLIMWVENHSSSLSWIKVAVPLLVWEAGGVCLGLAYAVYAGTEGRDRIRVMRV